MDPDILGMMIFLEQMKLDLSTILPTISTLVQKAKSKNKP